MSSQRRSSDGQVDLRLEFCRPRRIVEIDRGRWEKGKGETRTTGTLDFHFFPFFSFNQYKRLSMVL